MSPQAGYLLQEQVLPRLRSAIPHAVRCVGTEDHQELIQDATCLAARILHNAEQKGKKVTGSTVAFHRHHGSHHLMNKGSKLAGLAAQLQRCSSRNRIGFQEAASEAWDNLRHQRLPSKPSASIVAALVIESRLIGQLLTSEERSELVRLANAAMERYDRRINPSNKLGNLLAGVLKEL